MLSSAPGTGALVVICTLLVAAVALAGCGLLARDDAPALPEGFSQIQSVAFQDDIRVTTYSGSGGVDDVLAAFVRWSQAAGWEMEDTDLVEAEFLGVFGVLDDADDDAGIAVAVLTSDDQIKLLTITRAGGATIASTVVGPAAVIYGYYQAEDSDPDPADAGDTLPAEEPPLPDRWLAFETPLDLIEAFTLLEFRVGGGQQRYEYVALDQYDGDDAHHIQMEFAGSVLDIWVDLQGEVVHSLFDGEETPTALEMGQSTVELFMGWIMSGFMDFRRLEADSDWVQEDTMVMGDFGPTIMEVRRLVVVDPAVPAYVIEIEYADMGTYDMLTLYRAGGMDVLRIIEFQAR